jgi:serine/threonine protein kinase
MALRYLHSHKILHRDLKPANILLVPGVYGEYIAKMADFGVSTAVGMSSTRGTNSGKVGTCMYIAPELFDDDLSVKEATSAALDLYAFGVTANELFSGERPWEGRNDAFVTKAVDKGKRPAAFIATGPAEEALLLLIGDSTSGCLHQDRACRPAASLICDTLLPLLESDGNTEFIIHKLELYVIMLLVLLPLPPLNKLTLAAAPSTGKI